MNDKRQKDQLALDFFPELKSEARKVPEEGTESFTAKRGTESPTSSTAKLMEEVCAWENCLQALKRVKTNKGKPGIDGMTVEELPDYLNEHWATIREQLLEGSYKAQPVKRVEIPKPDGGVRKLGIPTALDRFIQQAVLQVSPATVGPKVFGTQLWLPPREVGASGCSQGPAVCGRGLQLGSGPGSGEIL